MIKVQHQSLQDFIKQVFQKLGASENLAAKASNVLIAADLRGIDSHGVARLDGFVRLIEDGRISLKSQSQLKHETPSTANIDAHKGLGLVVAQNAMQVAIKKAEQVGSAWVAVYNSSHFGIAAYHAMMALPHNMIGIAMTNASPLVAPTGSTDKLLGTNPMAFAIPAKNQPHFVADFSTSAAANGKLEILQRANKSVPIGLVQDKYGNESKDPGILKDEGALLPLGSGSEYSSHKGYCLGAVVDILTGVLSGANYGPWVPPFVSFLDEKQGQPGQGIGHMLGALRVDAFQNKEEFLDQMDRWITTFRKANPIHPDQVVQIPGDSERLSNANRKKQGIPLSTKVIQKLKTLSTKFQLDDQLDSLINKIKANS